MILFFSTAFVDCIHHVSREDSKLLLDTLELSYLRSTIMITVHWKRNKLKRRYRQHLHIMGFCRLDSLVSPRPDIYKSKLTHRPIAELVYVWTSMSKHLVWNQLLTLNDYITANSRGGTKPCLLSCCLVALLTCSLEKPINPCLPHLSPCSFVAL